MQLPRGTFREIRKKVILRDLLLELGQTRFTGTCGLVSGPATGSFVFREGACILAKFRGETADTGWEAMMQSAGESVDVILATLDEAQVKLSLEFNALCRLTGNGLITDIPPPREESGNAGNLRASHTALSFPVPVKSSRRRAVIITGPETSVPPGALTGEHHEIPRSVHSHQGEKRAATENGTSPGGEKEDLESDIDALDSMDLEHVTSRIRSDCKILIKQLQLEHLMEHEKR
jgi:hypothetical protein